MKSKQDSSHTTFQPIFNYLFGAKDFEFDFTKVPSDKIERRKKNIRESQFKNLGIDPSNTTQVEELKAFITEHTKMVKLGKFLFGEDFKLNDPRKGIDEEAVFNQFNYLNEQYGYFKTPDKHSEEFKQYLECYAVCLYKAKVIEHNDNGNEVYDRAYKILVLFPKGKNSNLFTAVDNFIPQYASHLPNPIHDLFQHEIPKANTYDLNKWRELVHKKGEYIIQNLANAPKVEEILGASPKTVSELDEALSEISYPRAKENLELAKLCKHYKVSEEIFNRCLDLIKDGTIKIKSKDNIPSVIVDIGKEVDEGLKGYYLVKLPARDLRGLILGKITNCCQSVGSAGEKYAIKGMVGEETGFYLLLKSNSKNQKIDWDKVDWRDLERNFTISGQGNIWRGENGSMTIGCWENQNPTGHDIIAVKSLPVLASRIMKEDSSIERFTIGVGGKTPKEFKDQYAQVQYDAPKDNFFDNDAKSQVALKETEKLTRVKEELVKRTRIKEQGHILSAKQGQMILDLEETVLKRLSESGKYDVLTSLHIPHYKEGLEKFEESILEILNIKEKNEEKFKLLTSRDALEALKMGLVTIQDLKDIDNEKIKLLISEDALRAYKTGKVSFQDLKDLDNERIKLLISWEVVAAYKTGQVDYKVLIDDNTLGIKYRILKAIAEHICKENGDLEYIANIPESKYKILTSIDVLAAYETGKVRLHELKDLDNEKIELLTSSEASTAYETGQMSLQDLKSLDNKKIQLLTYNALGAYKTGKVSFHDLKDLDDERIKLLISWEVVATYKTGQVDYKVLIDDNILGIKYKILKAVAEHICKENGALEYIANIPESKYEILTSIGVLKAYKAGKVSLHDLKDLGEEKIKLLTSKDAIKAYEAVKVSLHDLKELDDEKIKLLTSRAAISACRTGKVSLHDIKDLGEEKIKLLTSKNAIKAYKTGKASCQELKDLSEDKIKLLTSWDAVIAYKTGKVSAQELEDLSEDKIKLLTSWDVVIAYKTGKVSAQELKDLREDKIKLLTSRDAVEAYKTGKVGVPDLKELDNKEIKLLVSSQAIWLYSNTKASTNDLKGLTKEQLEIMNSSFKLEHNSNSHLSVKDIIKITLLSESIGANLFSLKSDSHKEGIENIQESLKEVINKIKTENPNFDTSQLVPGSIEWDKQGYAKSNEGLTGIYYKASSTTILSDHSIELHIPKVKITPGVKNQLESYIKVTSNQSQDLISRGGYS